MKEPIEVSISKSNSNPLAYMIEFGTEWKQYIDYFVGDKMGIFANISFSPKISPKFFTYSLVRVGNDSRFLLNFSMKTNITEGTALSLNLAALPIREAKFKISNPNISIEMAEYIYCGKPNYVFNQGKILYLPEFIINL